MGVLIIAVNLFFEVLIYLILGRAILSWFVRNPYDMLGKLYSLAIQITEPIISPCRHILARFGMTGTIDFSPILALIGLSILRRIIIYILMTLSF